MPPWKKSRSETDDLAAEVFRAWVVECYECSLSDYSNFSKGEESAARLFRLAGWAMRNGNSFCPSCAKMIFP